MEKIDIKVKIRNIKKSSSPLDILPKYLPDVFNSDYFFISYSHKDYKEVYEDLLRLQDNGLHIWYDRGMPAGKDWQEIATKYMYPYACKGVIFYLSKNSIVSDATIRELKCAKEQNKPVIVVHLNDDKNEALHEMINYLADDKQRQDYYQILPSTVIYLPLSMPIELKIEKIKANLKETPKLKITYQYVEEIDTYEAIIEKSFDTNVTSINKYDILNSFKLKDYRKKRKEGFLAECLFIKRFAFANNDLLQTVDVSFFDKVYQVTIESCAFADCISLKEFIGSPEWDPTYLYIQKGAFLNCSSLKSLNCGFCLNYDGSPEAFKNCVSLEDVEVKTSNIIGSEAFYNCRSLKRVELKENVRKIERGAFANCISLESIYIPGRDVELSSYCFSGCTSLKEISLPGRVVCERRSNPFNGCTALSRIFFRGEKKDYLSNEGLVRAITVGCKSATEVVCNDGVVPIIRDKK